MSSKKTGLYLGTFDPFHNGHYFSIVKSFEFVDEVIIQPHNLRPNSKKHTSLESRLKMCDLGCLDLKKVKVREEKRNVYKHRKDGKFRYQLIKWVEEEIGQAPIVIMGSDKVTKEMYKDSKSELLEIPHIIFLRPGHDELDILKLKNLFKEAYFLNPIGDISSSNIRKLIRKGADVSNFVQNRVLKYIKENNLYV